MFSEKHIFLVCWGLYVSVYKQKKKVILVEGESLGLLFLFLAMNTLRKISNSPVNGNSAHMADGYEWKHREDHVHTLSTFTEGRLPKLKYHVYMQLLCQGLGGHATLSHFLKKSNLEILQYFSAYKSVQEVFHKDRSNILFFIRD